VVVTTMGVMRFKPDTREMYLESFHPGLSAQAIADETGFPLATEGAVETPVPSLDELYILREIVDPERVFLR